MEVELRQLRPRDDAHLAGRERVGIVQTNDHVGTAEALVEVIGQHGLGAVDGFLRRLADDHHRAVPAGARGGECARAAEQHRRVHVMSAGVHHADVLAARVLGA